MVGHRPPGAYYVLGASQALWGRSLPAARLTSIGFGLALVVLTAALGYRLGGPACGVFAAAFLATQGAIVGYYATAQYHAIVGATVVTGLLVWLGRDTPVRNVVGAGILGSLFFLRTHMWPLLPVVLLLSLIRARRAWERVAVAAVMVLPPAGFFLWDWRHLKIISLVPFLGHLVAPLGYLPFTYLDGRPQQGLEQQTWALVSLVRRYEFLALATVVLLGLVAWRVWRGAPPAHYVGNRRVNLIAGLFVYLLGSLFVVFRINFKWIGFYFASLAPMLALVLGWLTSGFLSDPGVARRTKVGFSLGLLALMVLPVWVNRNPLLPTGALAAADPFRAVQEAGRHLARLLPADASVFFLGQVDVFYVSGRTPTHLQQVTNYNTLAFRDEDNAATLKSGYYGMPQVEQWLGRDAEYAVVSPETMATFPEESGHPDVIQPKMTRIGELLAERFALVDVVAEYPYYSYEVYRRR